MQFIELTPENFKKYAAKSPYKSFYQTPEIARLREQNGWTAYYFGVKNGKTLKAAAMVVARPTFLGKSTFYCPGGPLLDYEDADLVNFFFKHLKKYAKSHNGYLLHIEPYYELIARDRSGEVVKTGFDHHSALKNLQAAGLTPCATSDEPKYSFAMELTGRTPEQIFQDMKANTRNHIRKAEKKGVQIRELSREELGIFKQITESTSNRRDFQDKSLSYYEQMYDLFAASGEVKFLLAEADGTPMSAAMFMLYGDEVIYLFSGSEEKYMKEYNAQYLIQWHMIKYAAEHGYKRYNFYGIQGLPDQNAKDYGIYSFKKGFDSTANAHVIELLGAHEAPVNLPFYALHRTLSSFKSKLNPIFVL